MRSLALALALALVAVAPAPAHEVKKGDMTVVHPMSRPVLEGRTAAAYMEIVNEGDETDTLVGASSPAFGAAELHESYEENGVSKMRHVEALEIPAGGAVMLEHGALHLMLFDAKQGFEPGDMFPLTLTFGHAGEIDVHVMVEEMSGHGHTGHGSGHGHDATTE